MKLKLSNIGIVKSAEIEVNTITMLTGNNNSGKSTIGKVLYGTSVVQNMISNEEILINKYKSILNELSGISRWMNNSEYHKLFDETRELFNNIEMPYIYDDEELDLLTFSEKIDRLDTNINQLIELIDSFSEVEPMSQKNFDISVINLKQRVEQSADDNATKIITFEDILRTEFSGNFVSENKKKNEKSFIEVFEDNGDIIKLYTKNDEIDFNKSVFETSREYAEAIYFDDPFLLDDPFLRPRPVHISRNNPLSKYKHRRNTLFQLNHASRRRNYFDETIQDKNIKEIFSKVLGGEVRRGNGGYFYKRPNFISEVSFDSLSAGMKAFSIIQMMMEYGLLNNIEYLILDEPETHLHPEWQVKFAELVTLISQYYPIRILVTSHSPYFIEALDIYSKKNNIKDVKFYHSQSTENLDLCTFEDVTNNLDVVYTDMYRPLNFLEELRDDVGR